MTKRRKIITAIFVFLFFLIALLALHNVPRNISDADAKYIALIVKAGGYDYDEISKSAHDNFESEIEFIRAMQDAILAKTPQQKGIANGNSREPEDIYKLDYAECGDRSRFLEKAFRLAGFETRYASIYSTKDTKYPLFKKGGDGKTSHALVEVKTSKGWMIVDSVVRWVGLTKGGDVVGLEEWTDKKNSEWDKGEPYFLIQDDFIYIYGLYSRHGQFYAPYTPYIPDINWPEFLRYNLF